MPPGRPRQFDPPTALNHAMELFWSRGYDGTSMQELLTATGLSRSSLYQTFGDKHHLFSSCLDRYREATADAMWQRLEQANSGREFIERTLRRAADERFAPSGPRGCLILNTATEFGYRDDDVTRKVQAGLSSFRTVFVEAVRRGQADGSIARDHDPDKLAAYLVAGMGGVRTMVKGKASEDDIESACEVIIAALD